MIKKSREDRGEKKAMDVSGAEETAHTEVNSVNFISGGKAKSHPLIVHTHFTIATLSFAPGPCVSTQGLYLRWRTLLPRRDSTDTVDVEQLLHGLQHHTPECNKF